MFCSKRTDIILVICGSAASWIINKVVNNKGGLHNRLTCQIQLQAFDILETKFYNAVFEINKITIKHLSTRKNYLLKKTKTRKNVFKTIITLNGAKNNEYYLSAINNQIKIDELLNL